MLVFILASAIHAVTYSRWLMHNGNKTGGIGIYVIVLIALALPVYRMMAAP